MRKTTCLKDKNRRLGTAFASIMIVCLMITFLPLYEADADDTSELQGLLNESDSKITLQKNYTITSTINISRDVVINGNNYSITYSGTGAAVEITSGTSITLEKLVINAEGNNARGLNITSNTTDLSLIECEIKANQRGISYVFDDYVVANNVNLTIDNTDILDSRISNYDYDVTTSTDTRGISLYGLENSTINIVNGSSIKGFKYSIISSNDEDDGVRKGGNTFNVTDSLIIGWTTFNVWTVKNTFNITDSTLVGINNLDSGNGWNNYATFVIVDGIYGGKSENKNVVSFNGGSLIAYQTNTAIEWLILESSESFTEFNFNLHEGAPVVICYDYYLEPFRVKDSLKSINKTGWENVKESPFFTDGTGFRYKVVDYRSNAVELVNPKSYGSSNVPSSTYSAISIIPEKVSIYNNDFQIIGISDKAFYGSDISNITLNEGLLYIDGSAFAGSGLTSLTLPSTVEEIGDSAFYGCSSLSTIILNDGLTTIGDDAFNLNPSLSTTGAVGKLEQITIPSTVTEIGNNFLKGAFKSDGTSYVLFLSDEAPTIGSDAFITSYDPQANPKHDLKIYYPGDSQNSYRAALGDCYSVSEGYSISPGCSSLSISVGGTAKVNIAHQSDIFTITSSASNDSINISADSSDILTVYGNSIGDSTITLRLSYGGITLDEAVIAVSVIEASDPDSGTTTTVETSTTTDEKTGQEISTSKITVNDAEGAEISNEISITTATSDESIKTEATISNNEAVVKVTASSNASLNDAIVQAELISSVITDDSALPDDVAKTEIVIEKESNGPSVTLTLDVVKSMVDDVDAGSRVQIVVDDHDEEAMTPAQTSAVGDGTAFEISALIIDNASEDVIGTIHDLGSSVKAFLPYQESMGDPVNLGVFYIDPQGNKVDMKSEYDPSKNGFIFQTDHFSLFAIIEMPSEEPDYPYVPDYDDDDYVIVTPTIVSKTNDSEETTKTIACAAAAVVAALMAIYLVIDSRRSS